MADWGPAGLLRPVSDQELASVGLKGADFAQHAWDQAHVGNTLYAVPLDTHTLVLYVNLTLARKAGLVDASGKLKPITSMADFEADMRAIKAKTGAYGVEFAERLHRRRRVARVVLVGAPAGRAGHHRTRRPRTARPVRPRLRQWRAGSRKG